MGLGISVLKELPGRQVLMSSQGWETRPWRCDDGGDGPDRWQMDRPVVHTNMEGAGWTDGPKSAWRVREEAPRRASPHQPKKGRY